MVFSYNWLQSFFKSKLPEPKKLSDSITLRIFEVDGIKKSGKDQAIDIDVLPSRAGDCFSHVGIAREISAILGKKPIFPNTKLKKNSFKEKSPISVEVKNSKDCQRYTAAIIKNIEVKPSPLWMKDLLAVCGVQSINNIVDIVNYAMLETGQPMHAFDLDKISGNKIIVGKAKDGQEITTLDDKKYVLNKNILAISDSEKILGIAGIKGGKNAEIDKETSSIVLESANFNRLLIRKGSANLKLRTDASLRFEHGMDSNLTEEGIKRAIDLIHQEAEGKLVNVIDFYPVKRKKKKIKLDLEYLRSLLGANVKNSEAKKILLGLGFVVLKENQKYLEIEVPTRRIDVSRQEDLIEEVARIYGYEKIKSFLPEMPIAAPSRNKDFYWSEKVKEILKNAGFCETYNHSFISQKQSEIFEYQEKELIEVEKPVSLDQKYLRPGLIVHLLENLGKNEKFFKDFKIFELGKVFEKQNEITEKEELAGIITGDSFYEVKGTVELLFEKLGIKEVEFKDFSSDLKFLHINKKAKILSKSKEIGFIGNISFKMLENLKIKSNASFFLLCFEKIKEIAEEKQHYRQIAKFPTTARDLSVIIPEKEKYENILKTVKKFKTPLIEKIELSDVYRGKEIPENKKNITLRFTYRDDKKTLTAKEVNKLHQKIIEKVEENKNWQVRK